MATSGGSVLTLKRKRWLSLMQECHFVLREFGMRRPVAHQFHYPELYSMLAVQHRFIYHDFTQIGITCSVLFI